MTLGSRSLLGVLLGSILTLGLHPVSRQYLFGAFKVMSAASVGRLADVRPTVLPPPNNKLAAAIWLQMACEKKLRGADLSSKELETLEGLARRGSEIDRENGFWLQMVAVWESYENKPFEAKQDWIKAGGCNVWNDLQTPRLVEMRNRLAGLGGWNQAWTYGYVYFARSEAPSAVIEQYARSLTSDSDDATLDGIKLRYATICNGSLLRDGSRSIRVGYRGAGMIELATYPTYLSTTMKHYKRIWIAQTSMTANLRKSGMTDQAHHADQVFRQNEGWLALVQRQSTEENLRSMCFQSILYASMPGGFLICSGIGLILFGVGKSLAKFATFSRFTPGILLPVDLLFALLLYEFSRSWLAAGLLAISMPFLLVSPGSIRKSVEMQIGPIFSLAIFIVSLISLASFTVFLISTSTPSRALLNNLGPQGDYASDSNLFFTVTCTMGCLIFLIPPTWAVFRKQPTPAVLAKAIEKLGTYVMVISLVLCVTLTPISIYFDQSCGQELKKIVENEPLYYLLS